MRGMGWIVVVLGLLWAGACAPAETPARVCAPGATQACSCSDGRMGAQSCDDSGGRWAACVCMTAPPTGDGGVCSGTMCGAECVDTSVSSAHCGSCGNACARDAVCNQGSCELSCGLGQAACSGACRDLRADPANCGACGRSCGGDDCVSGTCRPRCPAGQMSCSGACVEVQTDARNCGACGVACGGTQRCSAGSCVDPSSSVRVSWTFPGLWTFSGSADTWLPTYVTHLMGLRPPVTHSVRMELACASVTNSGSASQRVDIEMRIPSLAEPVMQSVTVAAGATEEVCPTPAFNNTLRGLRAEQPGAIELYARLSDGTEVARTMRSFTATPGNGVLWGGVGSQQAMGELASVFVTPNDPTVLGLRPAVERRSVFPGGFGGGAAFNRTPYLRSNSVGVGAWVGESIFLRRGTSVAWSLQSVSGGADADIDVYAFTASQYEAWRASGGTAAITAARDQRTGATGNFTAPADGWHVFILFNTNDNFVSRTVSWTRSVTGYDVARDALSAIFNELRARGLSYTNIGAAYFEGWQRIRRPAESIAMRSANCIDGALLFASVLEGAGLPPYLVLVPGHAYVGVRMGPEADAPVLPIETTMVGGTNTADQAIDCALGACPGDVAMPRFLIDVAGARRAGIRSIPTS